MGRAQQVQRRNRGYQPSESRSAGKGRCSRSDMHRSDQGISFQNHHTQADVQTVTRRSTVSAMVGDVPVGSAYPIVVQSMTNTDTGDASATALQVAELARA